MALKKLEFLGQSRDAHNVKGGTFPKRKFELQYKMPRVVILMCNIDRLMSILTNSPHFLKIDLGRLAGVL